MNYLAHYWLDEHRHDAAFSVGGALPDLARLRGTGFRLRPGGLPEDYQPSRLAQSLEAGLARHYQIDARWHNAPIFKALDALVAQGLDKAGIRLVRPSFARHIGAEMLLDRVLLRRDPTLADRFYACFTRAILEEAYRLAALKGYADWEPRLRTGIDRFLSRRFLSDYAGDYLSRSWPGIYTHITGDASAETYPAPHWQALVEQLTGQIAQMVDWHTLQQI